MKIQGPGVPTGPAGGVRRKEAGRDGARFSVPDDAEDGAAEITGAGPAASVAPLLALQEMGPDPEERRRAFRHGNDLLDRLEELRLGLLLGHFPKERLQSLAEMARQGNGRAADPRIAAVLAEIELRAEVELAKLGL